LADEQTKPKDTKLHAMAKEGLEVTGPKEQDPRKPVTKKKTD